MAPNMHNTLLQAKLKYIIMIQSPVEKRKEWVISPTLIKGLQTREIKSHYGPICMLVESMKNKK